MVVGLVKRNLRAETEATAAAMPYTERMRTSSRFAPIFLAPMSLAVLAIGACGSDANNSMFDGGGGGGGPASDGGSDQTAPPVCTGGKSACAGACIDPQTDPLNCGTCGMKCSGTGAACCAGTCVVDTASCAFALSEAQPAEGAVNGGDYVTLKGQGFFAGMEVLIDGAPAPTLVTDSMTALVQTPPDTAGAKDITIRGNQKTSTLAGGFLYTLGSIQLPWQEIKMAEVRGEDPGLAVMQDNRVLIAGGTTVPDSTVDALANAEIFARANNTVGAAQGPMAVPRWHVGAVPLMTGKVLVIGGACYPDNSHCNATADATKAELFDPTTNTFAATSKPVTAPRNYVRAVLLPDGRVLIASGDTQNADIYDPKADTFTQVPTLAIHTFGFMVRLRDGRAMLGGGDAGQTAVELFDWKTNTFSMAAPLNAGRSMLTAHTLPDGRVIAIGGASMSAGGVDAPQDTMELYDPVANTWTVAPYKLSTPRCWHASALVRDGTVVVMGGYNVDKSCVMTAASQNVDQIDPTSNSVAMFGSLPNENTEWTAVTLLDGSVVGVGGGACSATVALPDVYFLQGIKSVK